MNGFNSKVVCKNSSVTIWEILFNIAIPIIHHKWGGRFATTKGGPFIKQPIIVNPPSRVFENRKAVVVRPKWGGLMKTLHERCVAGNLGKKTRLLHSGYCSRINVLMYGIFWLYFPFTSFSELY